MSNPIDELLVLEQQLETFGLKWAEYSAEAGRLDDLSKSVLSQIMIEHPGEPMNQREMRARADERYIAHLAGTASARSLANQYRVRYDTVQAKIEIRRSANALIRAQIGLAR